MNGAPEPNIAVLMESYGQPSFSTTTYTDSSGFYLDSLRVPNTLTFASVTTHCRSDSFYITPNDQNLTLNIPCTIGLGSCSADFGLTQFANNRFRFTSHGVGNLVYAWDLGDGTTSSLSQVDHVYSTAGVYQVCLTITDTTLNCTDVSCHQITVGSNTGSCEAGFSYFLRAGSNNSYQFVDSSVVGPNAIYSWDFGNGTTSNQSHPIVNFSPGTYSVCLTVIDTLASGACTDTFCETIVVGGSGNICDADFDTQQTGLLLYDFTSQTPNPNATFSWDFGDGGSSTGTSARHSFPTTGDYTVCLTVIDSITNCFDQQCQVLSIIPDTSCFSGFSYQDLGSSQYQFTSNVSPGVVAYSWNFGDGTRSSDANPQHTFLSNGIYNVCLYVLNADGCSDISCQTISIGSGNPACIADFDYVLLPNNGISFLNKSQGGTGVAQFTSSWDFGDGRTSSSTNPARGFPNLPDSLIVCLAISSNTCTDTICKVLNFMPDTTGVGCDADFDALPLPNGAVQFLNLSHGGTAGGQNYNSYWDFGDGSSSNARNPIHSFANIQDSAYVCLYIQGSNICSDTICKWIIPLPDSTGVGCDAAFDSHHTGSGIVAFNSLCPSPNLSYNWTFGDGTSSSDESPVHSYANPGLYHVCLEVSDSTINCNATFCDSVYIGNIGGGSCQIVPDFTYRDLGNGSFSFVDLSTHNGIPGTNSGLTYYWTFDNIDSSFSQNPTYTFNTVGPYNVCLTISDSSGNCIATTCIVVSANNPVNGFNISGGVLADSQLIFNGVVYLIHHDTTANGGTLTAVDSVYLAQSHFTFHNVQPGSYLVKSALLSASPLYQSYLPTYLGDELLWNLATSVVVTNSNQVLPYINLIPGNNPGGPGFIGGSVIQGANKNLGDGLPGVSVLLLTEQDEPVKHTVTDGDGAYEFKNLTYGTYHLYVEIPGKLSEKWAVSLDGQGERFESADFRVLSAEVLASGATGIQDLSFGELLNVYPNPTKGRLTLEVDLEVQKDLKISVMSLVGQKLIEKNILQVIGTRKIELELGELIQGSYLLRIEAEGESLSRLIVKEK